MALDYGQKRTGIATTDPLQIIATPLETVSTNVLFEFFENYLTQETVDCIVIGEPKHKDGTATKLEPHIKGFINKLQKRFPEVKIDRQDEAYTSKMAEDVIRKTVKKQKNRQDKGLVDQVSACLILQEYMGFL